MCIRDSVRLADREVPALAVVGGALADLGEIGHLVGHHPGRQVRVAGRPEVVGIGDERPADAPGPQRGDEAGLP